tara:strand:- start:136 stop:369 length:234 start_codon:yes stop_codon:yes gene_type:complete
LQLVESYIAGRVAATSSLAVRTLHYKYGSDANLQERNRSGVHKEEDRIAVVLIEGGGRLSLDEPNWGVDSQGFVGKG